MSSWTSPASSDGEKGAERPAFQKGGEWDGGEGGGAGSALYTLWEKYPTIIFFSNGKHTCI